jgi:hypothetical protein
MVTDEITIVNPGGVRAWGVERGVSRETVFYTAKGRTGDVPENTEGGKGDSWGVAFRASERPRGSAFDEPLKPSEPGSGNGEDIRAGSEVVGVETVEAGKSQRGCGNPAFELTI